MKLKNHAVEGLQKALEEERAHCSTLQLEIEVVQSELERTSECSRRQQEKLNKHHRLVESERTITETIIYACELAVEWRDIIRDLSQEANALNKSLANGYDQRVQHI